MFQIERRSRILHAVRTDGRLTVNEAAECFNTTKETIRRDLAELHQAGLIRRFHGGAVAAAPPPFERLLERHGRSTSRRSSASARPPSPPCPIVAW